MLLKLLLSGDGGQGIQTIADIISQAVFKKDLNISVIPNYGLEQRGGSSLAFLKISDEEIVYPKFSRADILLIMSEQSRIRTKQFQVSGVQIIDVENFKEKLNTENIKLFSYNIFFLGVLTKILEAKKIITYDDVYQILEKKLIKKSNWEDNKKAFEIGFNI